MDKNKQLFVCGGCNAKIGPGNLNKILDELPKSHDDRVLVGYNSTDDAAIIKINDEQAMIQTVDFFPPMISDPYLFGKIAATNALSDVYAMGGEVVSALNIVAFPEEKDLDILKEILRGGAEKVIEANASIVGGHSIHDPMIKYGLCVSGLIHPDKILKNDNCKLHDHLLLTKPLGVSIICAGKSVGEVSDEAFNEAIDYMTTLNKYAMDIIKKYHISSCTDVTGFGLAGHLHEMLHNEFSAELDSKKIPYFKEAYEASKNFIYTAGGQRNRNHMEDKIEFKIDDFGIEEIIFDPQTSGGLLVSVNDDEVDDLIKELEANNIFVADFGKVVEKEDKEIIVY